MGTGLQDVSLTSVFSAFCDNGGGDGIAGWWDEIAG
ncbi:hypothetical protein CLOBOL_02560 [Enterocloster bolteae ATCC BAA-613]|uniref:Uncharacterized protein n=1 Tax=Enterocloster bolteae (strain ATCC BAA-613 / DSM 15670 / CCUG 46953 / JCM 12243 / WAL 16351) TaxID=411902 RepID=A8RPT9_ENTBW|nr:hypothetical protein CLOBOL_02560 [Enterocloster bolteae ATCC BAA-613]